MFVFKEIAIICETYGLVTYYIDHYRIIIIDHYRSTKFYKVYYTKELNKNGVVIVRPLCVVLAALASDFGHGLHPCELPGISGPREVHQRQARSQRYRSNRTSMEFLTDLV